MPEFISSSALAQMELVSVIHPSQDWSDISFSNHSQDCTSYFLLPVHNFMSLLLFTSAIVRT
jgi:hypothetical protein